MVFYEKKYSWDVHAINIGLSEIENIRNSCLVDIRDLLNGYHKSNRDISYYDLILGDWLEGFLHVCYASWMDVKIGNIGVFTSELNIAAHPGEYKNTCVNSGEFHSHLKGMILKLLSEDGFKSFMFREKSITVKNKKVESKITKYFRGVLSRKPKIILTSPYYKCSSAEFISVVMGWRKWISWNDFGYPILFSCDVDWKFRVNSSLDNGAANSFFDIVKTLLPLHIPAIFLEGYEDYRKKILDIGVARPEAVYTANALHEHVSFKILIAEWKGEGTFLLAHQHGGNYGLDRIHAIENYEKRVCDRFYTWGWRNNNSSVKPLSPPYFKYKRNNKSKILLNCVSYPRFNFRIHFQPMSDSAERLVSETSRFVSCLCDNEFLTVRLYQDDYGWNMASKIKHLCSNVNFESGAILSLKSFSDSKLVIRNYLGTAWLETLFMNIPTVCFYDSSVYAFRNVAHELIELLKDVGVLHLSANSAALFVNKMNGNYSSWWDSTDVQYARSKFVKEYANFSPDWSKEWENEFNEVLSL